MRVAPLSGESVTPFQPNSGVVVLPRKTAPCSRSRATEGASSSHGPAARTVRDPLKVGPPRWSRMSFTVTGTPSSSPVSSPRSQRRADSSAWASAASASTRTKALTAGSVASIRARASRVASTGLSVPAR